MLKIWGVAYDAKNEFTQAVVGILEELSVTDKGEVTSGLFIKVVVPSIVLDAVEDPMESEPVVKLSQILKTDVELFACILLK